MVVSGRIHIRLFWHGCLEVQKKLNLLGDEGALHVNSSEIDIKHGGRVRSELLMNLIEISKNRNSTRKETARRQYIWKEFLQQIHSQLVLLLAEVPIHSKQEPRSDLSAVLTKFIYAWLVRFAPKRRIDDHESIVLVQVFRWKVLLHFS